MFIKLSRKNLKCRVEASLVGFLSISKKPGEYSGPFGILMFFMMMVCGIGGGDDDGYALELYLHNSSSLLISTPS